MLKNKTKKNFIILSMVTFCFIILNLFSTVSIFAQEIDNSLVAPIAAENQTETVAPNGNNSNSTLDADQGLPNTTVRQVQEKVNEKGFDIVRILQTAGKPVCVIAFIIAAIFLIIAALSKTGSVGKALLAMAIIALIYGLISAAPEIVQTISNWAQS